MADGFAIASVTAVLRHLISTSLGRFDLASIGSFSVTSSAPERLTGGNAPPDNGVNIFLFNVVPNTAYGMQRLPAYGADGVRTNDPYLALDLRYLLTAYGGNDFATETLLGLALQALHETPILTPAVIAAAATTVADNGNQLMRDSLTALAEQPEPVRITPHALPEDTMMELWPALNSGLRASMAYNLSAVLIERQRPRRVRPPVRASEVLVAALARMRISAIRPRAVPLGEAFFPVSFAAGDAITIDGSGLGAEHLIAVVDGRRIVRDANPANGEQFPLTLPTDLLPGVCGLQLVREVPRDGLPSLIGERSNLVPLPVHPALSETTDPSFERSGQEEDLISGTLTVTFRHPVGSAQRAVLILTRTTADASGNVPAYSFAALRVPRGEDAAVPPTVMSRQFAIAGVRGGDYLLRVEIDGVQSPLQVTDGTYSGPTVAIGGG